MILYLDDNMTSGILIALLQRAGHDVQIPADAGISGEDDPIHLTHAVRVNRVLLTYNYEDFEQLHELVTAAQGHHPGILVVRRDNDRKRDMSEAEIGPSPTWRAPVFPLPTSTRSSTTGGNRTAITPHPRW